MSCAPCLVCGKELRESFQEANGSVGSINQPVEAVNFMTQGHYGSTVYDPCDFSKPAEESERIEINVCDRCMVLASNQGRVLHFQSHKDDFPVPWVYAGASDEDRWGELSDEEVDRWFTEHQNQMAIKFEEAIRAREEEWKGKQL